MRTYTFRAKPKDLDFGKSVEGSLIDKHPLFGKGAGVYILTEQGQIEVEPDTVTLLPPEHRWEKILSQILRFIVLPLVLIIILLYLLKLITILIHNYIRYSGEMVIYNDKLNRTTLVDLFYKLNLQFANHESV
jgi:hypothetical protein